MGSVMRVVGTKKNVCTATIALGCAVAGTTMLTPAANASTTLNRPDTAGTASFVVPTRLAACQEITFALTGFPVNSTVMVRMNDAQKTWMTVKTDSRGVAADKTRLPCDLPPGKHYLRFLGAGINASGVSGGFSSRGATDFVVTAS